MTERLPRRPLARQLEDQPEERIPWDAFAASSDVSGPYGQPSTALIERAKGGKSRIGALDTPTNPVGEE
ncbi:hypothetical protein ACFU51_03880 [Streptomyces sp. NPDC057430]|uniref:hypothetical protein n=1 Tax=Streptomyces sp. NPDC057430 TaxID=3346131 RepID=UPI0036AC24E0